jgi:hypothetical protein
VPGKTPHEAVNAYVGPLQRNVSLISKGVLIPSNRDRLDFTSVLHLPDPVPLNGCPDLFLAFSQQYKIIKDEANGPFRVTTLHYKYAIETDSAEEIIGYHWHPDGPSPIKYAHLHLGPGAQIGRAQLDGKAHFPTGRVPFEDLVKLSIDVFGVKPDRTAWESVMEKTKGLFMRHKSW